jgi:hypothetical protein
MVAALWTACDLSRDVPGGYTSGTTGSGGNVGGTNLMTGPGGNGGTGLVLDAIPDPEAPCDAGLAIDSNDPVDAAAAIGICKQSSGADDWGLVEASWTMPDGSAAPTTAPEFDLGHGIMDGFGAELVPLEGASVLGLSSGAARQPTDPDFVPPAGYAKGYTAEVPDGVSQLSPSCPGDVFTGEPNDAIALEVVMVPHPDAKGLAFDFDFYTYEWPDWVCTEFNDYFVALLDPAPSSGKPNISFDSEGNLVTVNNALVSHCHCDGGPPCQAGMGPFVSYSCENGADRLEGTGFYGEADSGGNSRAATGWLTTQAPITPGETVRLRFATWDSGDGNLDSTTIIDNFRWLGDAEEDPETTPIPK